MRGDDDLTRWVRDGYARAYRSAVLICGNPADAEEAVQDAFLRVWRFRDALPNGDGREPWFYRVLVNACYSKLRREIPRRDRDAGPLADTGHPDGGPDGPDLLAEHAVVAGTVADSLSALPDSLRVPVVLRYFTGLSEREIATAIRRRPGTVKSRLHEARRRLAADPTLSALATDMGMAR
jgi:RNA polymerase sigma-70 factor (ECF subfamily)